MGPTTDRVRFDILLRGQPVVSKISPGMRGIIELIEELAVRGGGRGLFTGCAAGDTGMAVVVEVEGG